MQTRIQESGDTPNHRKKHRKTPKWRVYRWLMMVNGIKIPPTGLAVGPPLPLKRCFLCTFSLLNTEVPVPFSFLFFFEWIPRYPQNSPKFPKRLQVGLTSFASQRFSQLLGAEWAACGANEPMESKAFAADLTNIFQQGSGLPQKNGTHSCSLPCQHGTLSGTSRIWGSSPFYGRKSSLQG